MSKRALVVRGGWEGHAPVEATDLFIPVLRDHGYDARIEDSPEIYTDADLLAATDVLVQCVTMSTVSAAAIAGLRAAVANGLGLAGWHGGIVDSFRNAVDYAQLVGGQFVCHPAKPPTDRIGDETDVFIPHTVNITEAGHTHPITADVADFELVTEQYWVFHDDLNTVLATTIHPAQPWQEWPRPTVAPVIWTREWGAGRVVVVTPGHSIDILTHPIVHTIIERGILWASRTA